MILNRLGMILSCGALAITLEFSALAAALSSTSAGSGGAKVA
jgi:hypothetical protein